MAKSTKRRKLESFSRLCAEGTGEDINMEDPGARVNDVPSKKHFIIAVDFGTTFSSVAFIALEDPETRRRADPEQMDCIELYPNAPLNTYEPRREVPTESWYPK